VVTSNGVPFDVRGVVMLRRLDPNGEAYQRLWAHCPKQVNGIAIARRVRRLQVLHGAFCRPVVDDGKAIGSFVWHYADGSQRETEIIYGRDVRDWWIGGAQDLSYARSSGDRRSESERGRMVWRGVNPVAKQAGATLRLYLTPYENPQPDLEVTSLDFVSKMTTAAPFLIALTVEP